MSDFSSVLTYYFAGLFVVVAVVRWFRDRDGLTRLSWTLCGVPGYAFDLGFVTLLLVGIWIDRLGQPSFAHSRWWVGSLGLLCIADGMYAVRTGALLSELQRRRLEQGGGNPPFYARIFWNKNPSQTERWVRISGWCMAAIGLCFMLGALTRGASPPASDHADEMPPRSPIMRAKVRAGDDLVARVARAYTSLDSYADDGVLVETLYVEGRKLMFRTRFSTRFNRRERLLRFEFTTLSYAIPVRFVAWRIGADAFTWWTAEPRVVRRQDLMREIRVMAGVAHGTTSTALELIEGEPSMLLLMKSSKLLGIQRLASGELCYVLRGHLQGENLRMVWIDTKSLMIRRITDERSRINEKIELEHTVLYSPTVGASIDRRTIPFDPPSAPPQWLGNLVIGLRHIGIMQPEPTDNAM